jgi:hypothetical protein
MSMFATSLNNNNTSLMSAHAAGASGSFSVATARAMLFQRMPAELRSHVAFKHFYTDELDPASSDLSLRFFSLCITYFCSLCRLEGRRKHYLQNPSEKSGSSFARAHARARHVFQRLNATYSAILLRYNTHSDLTFPKKAKNSLRHGLNGDGDGIATIGGPYSAGAKPMGPAMKKVRAFEYFADELRFYEELYVFTEQLLRLAFVDERLQTPIAEEINAVFRGTRFNFGHLRRETAIRRAAASMEASGAALGGDLTHNYRHLAEVLVPPAPKISVKEAAAQRTPFIACRFASGKMNSRKYQRPDVALGFNTPSFRPTSALPVAPPLRVGGRRGDSPDQLSQTSNSSNRAAPSLGGPITFPPSHRAVQRFLAQRTASRARSPMAGVQAPLAARPLTGAGGGSRVAGKLKASVHVNRSSQGGASPRGESQHTFLPKLADFDVYDSQPATANGSVQLPVGSDDDRPASGGTVGLDFSGSFTADAPNALRRLSSEGGTSAGDDERPRSQSVAYGKVKQKAMQVRIASMLNPHRKLLKTPEVALLDEAIQIAPLDPVTGVEDWKAYDPMPEIDKVYQSLANGVVITSLAIPGDILCVYDASGYLVSTGDN